MSRIIITTDDQNLSFTNMPDIYSGDVNYDEVEFVFDETWNSMSRTAVFYTKNTLDNPVGVLLASDNIAKIPYELISNDTKLYIGVYGLLDDNIVKTSQVLVYKIEKGCPINIHEAESVTDAYWQQVLSVLGVTQQDISNINDRIDNLTYNTDSNINDINNKIIQINSNLEILQNNVTEIQNKLNTIEMSTLDEINVFLGINSNVENTEDSSSDSASENNTISGSESTETI